MDPEIVIRDIHMYGDDLTIPEAIARLCGGGPVTVTVTDPAPPGGDPRGHPRHGFEITICPAGTTGEPEPPRVSWGAPGSRPAEDAAWLADALMLASDLATRASTGPAALGHAAVIGDRHGRDAARRALGTATPATCQDITSRLDAGDQLVFDLFATPALSGEHGIGYDVADLATDLGLDPGDDVMTGAEETYCTAAGEAFWAEARRIARDRALQAAPAYHRSTR
jgi:hypothetical protein